MVAENYCSLKHADNNLLLSLYGIYIKSLVVGETDTSLFLFLHARVLIKPADLAILEGKNLIIFEVDADEPTKNFLSVLEKMLIACTEKNHDHPPRNVGDVPVTTTEDGVYLIEMRGEYGNYKFNKERLMGVRGSNYFVAIKRSVDWHEVSSSGRPIEGAKPLGFLGSYTEWSVSGLRNQKMKLGFAPLMWSLTSLLRGNNSCSDFLTVCVNLFEPARYPVIGRSIIQYPYSYCMLSLGFIELIYEWDGFSEWVIKCQGDEKAEFEFEVTEMTVQVYGDAGILEAMTITKINKGNIHKILGMAKCRTTEEVKKKV